MHSEPDSFVIIIDSSVKNEIIGPILSYVGKTLHLGLVLVVVIAKIGGNTSLISNIFLYKHFQRQSFQPQRSSDLPNLYTRELPNMNKF